MKLINWFKFPHQVTPIVKMNYELILTTSKKFPRQVVVPGEWNVKKLINSWKVAKIEDATIWKIPELVVPILSIWTKTSPDSNFPEKLITFLLIMQTKKKLF